MTDKNYNRQKLTSVNDTPIDITYEGSELPTAPAALDAGTTGNAEIIVLADADESGGGDVQDWWKVKLTPSISSVHPGASVLLVEVTPIKGDGEDGTKRTLNVDHDEDMDTWQAAAGRARQA